MELLVRSRISGLISIGANNVAGATRLSAEISKGSNAGANSAFVILLLDSAVNDTATATMGESIVNDAVAGIRSTADRNERAFLLRAMSSHAFPGIASRCAIDMVRITRIDSAVAPAAKASMVNQSRWRDESF